MATDTSKQCTLTNNTGKDVVITLAIPVNEISIATGSQSVGGILELLTTTDGDKVIKKGNTATVTLDHNSKANITPPAYITQYDLVVSDTNWLYPVSSIPVIQSINAGGTGFPAQTLSDGGAAIDQAATFLQAIAAFPNSGLAQDYGAALKEAEETANNLINATDAYSSGAAATAIEQITHQFFQGTKEYKDVSLADIVALNTYYNAIPALWAKYKDSTLYYLYSSNGTNAGFIGALSLSKSGAIDASKSNGGYTCTFTTAKTRFDKVGTDVDSSKPITLTYANGLFSDDPNSDSPAIALQGSFVKAALFAGDESNDNILILVNGVVNGDYCIGFDSPQTTSSPATTSTPTALSSDNLAQYWDVLTHPHSQQQWIISLCTLAGAILIFPTMGAALYGLYRVVKYKLAVKDALEKKIIEYTREEWNDLGRRTAKLQMATAMGDFYVLPNPKNTQGIEEVAKNNRVASQLAEGLKRQRLGLQKLEEYSSDLTINQKIVLNQSLGKIRDSIDTLNETPRAQLGKVLPSQFDTYDRITYDLQLLTGSLSEKFTEGTREFITGQFAVASELVKDARSFYDNEKVETPDPVPGEKFEPVED